MSTPRLFCERCHEQLTDEDERYIVKKSLRYTPMALAKHEAHLCGKCGRAWMKVVRQTSVVNEG